MRDGRGEGHAQGLDGIDLAKTRSTLMRAPLPAGDGVLAAHLRARNTIFPCFARQTIDRTRMGKTVPEGGLPVPIETRSITWRVQRAGRCGRSRDLYEIAIRANADHEEGGGGKRNDVQELAFALATGREYLASWKARGFQINDHPAGGCGSVFRSRDFFHAIAKFRAARLSGAGSFKPAEETDRKAQKPAFATRAPPLWNKSKARPVGKHAPRHHRGVRGGRGGCEKHEDRRCR